MKALLNINVEEQLGKSLISRSSSSELITYIKDNLCQNIELDFSEVEFMSRSFADQFHKEKVMLMSKHNVMVEVLNANEEVINMLKTVARTQNKPNRKFKVLPLYKFSDAETLNDYLLSI